MTLTTVPYPYQHRFVEKVRAHKDQLLAPIPGAGKSFMAIQAIEDIAAREDDFATALIICPQGVCYQWADQIAQHTDVPSHLEEHDGQEYRIPDEDHVRIVLGTPAERRIHYQHIGLREIRYVIIGLDTARRDIDDLIDMDPQVIVLDEARAIKHAHTKRAQALKRLRARHHLAIDGTPYDNPLGIFSIMEWVNKDALGPLAGFAADHVTWHANDPAHARDRSRNPEILRKKLEPWMERIGPGDKRLKGYMPDVAYTKHLVTVDKETDQTYKAMCRFLQFHYKKLSPKEKAMVRPEADDDGKSRVTAVNVRYGMLMRFLQHPGLVYNSPSYYARWLVKKGVIWLGMPTPKWDAFRLLLDRELETSDDKIVVLSTSVDVARFISHQYADESVFLPGGLKAAEKAAIVREFATDPAKRVFVGTNAAREGLDLRMASHVISYDRPSGMAAYEQGCARVSRAGSPHAQVKITDLIVSGSAEERQLNVLNARIAAAREVLDGIPMEDPGYSATLGRHLADVAASKGLIAST